MKLKVIVAVVGALFGVALAYAVVFTEDVSIDPGNLFIYGRDSGPRAGHAEIHFQISDPWYGEPWIALRDKGSFPAELEIAPVPWQYDQVTVKTQLAVLGVGVSSRGDWEASPPFDARLLLSGPWPYSYCALRDDGSSPATLEVNALREYKNVVIRSGTSGDVIIELGS